jgi:two-component system, chemotaxis family, protein-glutamate methylesterase/glutaminase
MESNPSFIVVIGTSAGGNNALIELVANLKADTDAAFFILMHLSRRSVGTFLLQSLQQVTSLPCKLAINEETIERGHIYIAPPDHHLLVDGSFRIILGQGPPENRWRPSINTLFRSAAAAFGNRVVGVILTGLLDDGTTGMEAIKRVGGITIVQDPNEAEFPDMPLSVLNRMEVDHCALLSEIPLIIHDIVTTEELKKKVSIIPQDLVKEAEMSLKVSTSLPAVAELGEKTVYSCPDCGGGLWRLKGSNLEQYRCHVGHTFTDEDLLRSQVEELESTLWVALRMMEERRNLLMQFYNKDLKKGLRSLADTHKSRAEELDLHVIKLKELLFANQRVA